MICPPCRKGKHEDCPERKRQQVLVKPAEVLQVKIDLLGGYKCDCQHKRGRLVRR